MKWLTIAQIKRRSQTAKGALKVSYEHWCQMYDATSKELRAEIDRTGSELYHTEYCGLCNYCDISSNRSCDDCVLTSFCVDDEALWRQAKIALESWYNKQNDGDWHTWKRAVKALRDKLKELMEK